LLNVVLAERETDIETRFAPHIKADVHRQFRRLSWEEIYNHVAQTTPHGPDQEMLAMLENKTIGYNSSGELQKAFSV
jgi:hypothetical protein